MSNIGWHRFNPYTTAVINDHKLAVGEVEKHEYYPALRVTAEMNDSQKETLRRYNSMRQMLIKHGLMDEK